MTTIVSVYRFCAQMKITLPSKFLLTFIRSVMNKCQSVHIKASTEGVHLMSVDSTDNLTCLCFIAKERLSCYSCVGAMSFQLDLRILYTMLELCGPIVTISGSITNIMMLHTYNGEILCEYALKACNIPHHEFNEQTVYDCIVHIPARTMVCISKSAGKVVDICCRGKTVTFTSNGYQHHSTIVLEDHVVKLSDIDLKVSAYHLSNIVNTKMVVLQMSEGKPVFLESVSGDLHMKYYLNTI